MPAAPPLLGSTGSTTFVLAALLVGLGLVMLGAAVWLVKATRTDVPALGPLEIVGDRRFARRDPESQAAALAAARPAGALGPAPMVEIEDDEPAAAAEPADPVAEPVELVAEPEESVEPEASVEAVEAVEADGDDEAEVDEVATEAAAEAPVAPDIAPSEVVEADEPDELAETADDAEVNEPAEAAPQSS